MDAVVELIWQFLPKDYEEISELQYKNYTIKISNGELKISIAPEVFDNNPTLSAEIEGFLDAHFMSRQLFSDKPYQLYGHHIKRTHEDGRKDISVRIKGAEIRAIAGRVDFKIGDKDGNVLKDSRQERLDNIERFTSLIQKHSNDQLFKALLLSFRNGQNDHENELVHLYEIRDALHRKFGDERSAQRRLNFSASKWREFGRLCNDAPLHQGRHRGKNMGALRDATEGELLDARRVAREMIEHYLRYLENPTGP